MKGYIPPDCTPPDRHREERESEDQRRRLEREPPRRLHEVLLDAAESFTARATALMLLLQWQDPEVFRRLPDLFDDPQLGRMAVRYSRPSDPTTAERLHGLLGPARGRHWPEAALALARAKDPSVRPFLLGWLGSGDTGEINVAVEGLVLLSTAGALELFQQAWDAGGGGEERRLILAAALLRLRDTRGAGLLEEVARRADGPWAVFAAFGLAGYDAPAGLPAHAEYPRRRRIGREAVAGYAGLELLRGAARLHGRRSQRGAGLGGEADPAT